MTPLAYAYNFEGHPSTKVTPISLLSSPHSPSSATPATAIMLLDVNNFYLSLALLVRLINRAALLRRLADKNLKVGQHRYKWYHGKKIRFEPKYASVTYLSVDRAPLTASGAEWLTAEGYSELIPKRHGPYRVLSIGPEHVMTHQEGVESLVSINHISRVTQEEDAHEQPLSKTVKSRETFPKCNLSEEQGHVIILHGTNHPPYQRRKAPRYILRW